MVAFTQAVHIADPTSQTLTPRTLAFAASRQDAADASINYTRRLFTLDGSRQDAADASISYDRRLFTLDGSKQDAADVSTNYERRLFNFDEYRQDHDPTQGIPIPSGEFRLVEVSVAGPDGEPLPEILWVQSAGIFPTSAPVVDGKAQLFLLSGVAYTEFLAIAHNPDADYNYVWPQAESSEPIGGYVKEGSLRFVPIEASAGSTGYSAGGGAQFGGG